MQVRTSLALTVAGLALAAVATGVQLVRAGLVTEFVGVTPDYVLNGPANPRCSSVADRQIDVRWLDRDDNESGFTVVRQGPLINGTSTAVYQVPATSGSNTTTTFSDTRVVPDALYTYTIRSFLGPALSPATSTSDGCTTQSLPLQPTDVTATGGPETTMVIRWNGNGIINEDGFRIYRLASGTDVYLLPDLVGVDATTVTDGRDPTHPLRTNSRYCYFAVAFNAEGPSGIPAGAQMACGRTWSQQPVVTDLSIETSNVPLPTFTWKFDDADPTPPLAEPTQTKVQMQVCASEFAKDTDGDYSNDCRDDDKRWDSGEVDIAAQKLDYFQNYPSGVAQHLLDFGSQRYYVRLRAWDDAGTPSEWATLPSGSFTLAPPAGALVEDFARLGGTRLLGAATFDPDNGGELVFGPSGGSATGKFSSLMQVVSVRLVASQVFTGTVTWEFRRTGDAAWVQAPADGSVPATWATPADSLEWRVTSLRDGMLGGFSLLANANHAPEVTACRATRLIGGTGDTFPFTVTVSDPDADFTYGVAEVEFDWDDGSGWAAPVHFGPSGPLTEFTRPTPWVAEGNYTPTVRVSDQYHATGDPFPCDTVLVGSATPAWLQTQDADVFSGGTIYARSPANQYNATYLVQANGDIQEFTTQGLNCLYGDSVCPSDLVRAPNYRSIPLPQPDIANPSQPLATILGSVDLAGILSGRYGAVTEYSDPTTDLTSSGGFFESLPSLASGARILNGAIAHVAHNAVISDPVVLGNAVDDVHPSGAGLVVVDGDLFINAPIAYSRDQIQASLRRLASIGWLVKGNVYVDPSVWAMDASDLSQACTSVDQLTSCAPAVVGTFYLYSRGAAADHGIFFTGSASAVADSPLKLGGLVVAQRFALQRNRPDATLPAELFQYDGRVFANPPPGLRDFATALPRWRPLAPLP